MTKIYCPYCTNEMNQVEEQQGQTLWHWWDCTDCEVFFEIKQMSWYPIKRNEHEVS